MPWGAVIGAGIGLAGSIFGSNKAEKNAAADRALEDKYRQRAADLADNQFDFAKEQYGDWKGKFDPLFYDIRGMMDDVEPDYGAIAGDVNSSFDAAQGMEERNMRRYGIRPTAGAARASQREYGIRRATTNVGARSAARQGAKDKRYGRYADLYNAGQGIGTTNASMVTNAMANQQSQANNSANAAGDWSRYNAGRADQSAQGWGQLAGGVDWGGVFNSVKGWFNTPATVAGSGGQSPQDFYSAGNSDLRLKENVQKVGEFHGANIYMWDWNDLAKERGVSDPTFGVIAQEHLDSGFVREVDGFFMVDYPGLFDSLTAH